MSDPAAYRDISEVEEWRVNDPIDRFKSFALAEGLISEDELAQIDREVMDTIDEVVEFARDSPEPELDSLWDNVYA